MVQLSSILFIATAVFSIASVQAIDPKMFRRAPSEGEIMRRMIDEYEIKLVRRAGVVAGCGSKGGILPTYCTAAGDGTHKGYCGAKNVYGVKSIAGNEADKTKAETCRSKGCGCTST